MNHVWVWLGFSFGKCFQASNTHGSAIFRQSPEGFSGSIRQIQYGLSSRSPMVFFGGFWQLSFIMIFLNMSCCSIDVHHLWVASLKSFMSVEYPIQPPWSFSSFSEQAAMDWQLITRQTRRFQACEFGLWIPRSGIWSETIGPVPPKPFQRKYHRVPKKH